MRTRPALLLLASLAIACGAPAVAAPPKLTIPAELRPAGDYVTLKPDTDAVSVTYVGLSGVDPFPSDFLKDARHFVLPIRGLKAGSYKFAAVAASKDGEQARVDFTAVVPGEPGTPTPPPVPPTPPDPPTPPKPAALYFLIVRPDGPASAEFTRTMGLAAWADLRKSGHSVKDKTLTDAAMIGVTLRDGTALPCVLTLREAADGKSSKIVRDAIPLPATESAIADLPKGVK